MKILERYILARVVRMFLATLLPVLAVLWLTQVLGRINLVTDSGQSIVSFLTLATLILPTVIPTVLPFGIVLGTAQTLTSLALRKGSMDNTTALVIDVRNFREAAK